MAGRPSIDLSLYKDLIINKFQDGISAFDISELLLAQHHISVKPRTIQRRLLEWQVSRRPKCDDNPQLRCRIAVLFYQCCLSDKNIIRVLQKEGYCVTPRSLERIRKAMGIKRKVMSIAETDHLLDEIVQKELDKGTIEGYGRGSLHTYFRNRMHIISRDRLFASICRLDPEGVTPRLNDLQRHCGEYIVPGPNYLWSVDGHCKLQHWGIEIYAAIDAYSRYVIWIYVGISCRTAISTLKQYLHTLTEVNVQPQIIRSDRGVETPILAAAHHELIKCHQEDASFDGCFRYGTSTANQRIESWWAQLTKTALNRWRDYFYKLIIDGVYDKDDLVDHIALLAIYMPILCEEIHMFADMWNSHTIRRQRNRPNSVTGQPVMLYHWPDEDVHDFGLVPDPEKLQEINNATSVWDMDEYLPATTRAWVENQLEELGYSGGRVSPEDAFPDGTRHHYVAYLQIRDVIRNHMESQEEPVLEECVKPVGGWGWEPSRTDFESREMDIYNEGADITGGDDDEDIKQEY